MTEELNRKHGKLSEPFSDNEVSWKPQVTTKGKNKQPIMRNGQQVAGCVAHIDARDVMNRLDEVVGAGNWSDSYRVLDAKHVECTLTVLGVSKSDVGETNEGGFADPIKSAYSDAFKRAAVKFGIGRHLYDMEMRWLPYDGYKIIEQGAPRGPKKPERPKVPADNGSPPDEQKPVAVDDGRIADLRSKLEENANPTWSSVASILVATGLYENDHHAFAAIQKHPDVPEGADIKMGSKLTGPEAALKLFDFGVERKAEPEKA